jgi:leucyl aminopeptidase
MVARNLAVVPSNTKDPGWVAAQARTLAGRNGLDVKIWSERELRAEGFGGLLAVGAASASPPRLVQLDYAPDGATSRTPRIVLVGKGITFDTGGLDLKPAEGMLAMKTDMSGSAIVLAVLADCRDLAVSVKVTGLLALAENGVGGAAYRPGDVITQYGGRTVEIGNTDAEGRIVMADALAYADLRLEPTVLLDIATLTGAARVALGRSMAPVYATDDVLTRALVAAGEATGELLWPMPLVEDYRAGLDSEVADINHIAGIGGGGGSISAALFLREFVGARRWAHLDIAGVGRSDVDRGLHTKGGTGFGARLLLTWLEEMS